MKIYKIIILTCCFSCFSILGYSTADHFYHKSLDTLEIKDLDGRSNDNIESIIPKIYKECEALLREINSALSQEAIAPKLAKLNKLFEKAKEIEQITCSKKIQDSRGEDLSEYVYKTITRCIMIHNNLSGSKISVDNVIN
jgi:hypothetical protein